MIVLSYWRVLYQIWWHLPLMLKVYLRPFWLLHIFFVLKIQNMRCWVQWLHLHDNSFTWSLFLLELLFYFLVFRAYLKRSFFASYSWKQQGYIIDLYRVVGTSDIKSREIAFFEIGDEIVDLLVIDFFFWID